jgi:hypothetical protein
VALCAATVGWQRHDERRLALETLRARRAALRIRLERQRMGDASLAGLPEAPIVMGISADFAAQIARMASARILDEVSLHLTDLHVHAEGELQKKLLALNIKAGTWSIDMTIQHVRAVLHPGPPTLDFRGAADRIGVQLPVRIEAGSGTATVRFRWDSHGAANIVCRDFAVEETVDGRTVPQDHLLRGTLHIVAAGESMEVRPELDDQHMRLRIHPSDETWARVGRAVEAQDSFWRCGIALKPDQLMERLHELTDRGFDVALPRDLFRQVRLPARIRPVVELAGHRADLSVAAVRVAVTASALWYGVDIRVRTGEP